MNSSVSLEIASYALFLEKLASCHCHMTFVTLDLAQSLVTLACEHDLGLEGQVHYRLVAGLAGKVQGVGEGG